MNAEMLASAWFLFCFVLKYLRDYFPDLLPSWDLDLENKRKVRKGKEVQQFHVTPVTWDDSVVQML